MCSGEDMGPLVLDINQLTVQSEELRNSQREHVNNVVQADTVLWGEVVTINTFVN